MSRRRLRRRQGTPTGLPLSRRRRARVRYLEPDQLKRHEQGIHRLDDAFGLVESGVMLPPKQRRGILDALGFRGFDTKATDDA